MYKYTIENGFYIVYYQSAKIKNKLGYYSFAAKVQREFTESVLKQIPNNITYIDGCASTGIKAMYALRLGKSIIAVDAFVNGTLIRNNFLNNQFLTNYAIYNASIITLPEAKFSQSILDLDVYGNSLLYLIKMKKIVNQYLFLTFTDLMNICGPGAKNFFKRFNLKFVKCAPLYEQAIRLLLVAISQVCNVMYVPLAIGRFTKYLRLYLIRTDKSVLSVAGSLCTCGIYYPQLQICKLCNTETKQIGPVYTEIIAGNLFFGFSKTQVFKRFSAKMPRDEQLFTYFKNAQYLITKSAFDKDYFSTEIYGETLANFLLGFYEYGPV